MKSTARQLGLALLAAAVAALAPRGALAGEEDRSLRKGRIKFRAGNHREAIEDFRAVIRREMNNAEGHFWLGKCYRRTSEFDKAAEHLERAREIRPQHEETYRVLGQVYLELGKRKEASGAHAVSERHLGSANKVGRQLLKQNPKDKESYEFLAQLAEAQGVRAEREGKQAEFEGKHTEALQHIAKVLEIDPNDMSSRLKQIELLVRLKRYGEAKRRCKETLRINPKYQAPQVWLAKIQLFEGEREDAIQTLTKLLDQKANHFEGRLLRAQAHLAQRKYEAALEDANLAAKLAARHPMPHIIRGAVFMELKKLDDAIQELRQAAAGLSGHSKHPQFWQCHFMLARCLIMKDDFRGAIDSLNHVVEADPENLAARLLLANTHVQQGYYDGAINVLLDSRRHFPDNIEILRLLGIAYLHKRDYDRARECFEELDKANPASARSKQILAGFCLAKNQPDLAIHHCLKALEAEPDNVDVRFILGSAYLRKNHLEGARAQFERVLELRGRHPGARLRLAEVHLRQRQPDRAREQYEHCIQEDPQQPDPRFRLAELHARLKQYDKAQAELEKLLDVERDTAKIHLAMAKLAYRRGEKEKAAAEARKAIAEAEQARKDDPKSTTNTHLLARVFLAALYRKDQNWDGALQELNAAIAEDPAFAPGYAAAALLVYLGRYDQAVKLFEQAAQRQKGAAKLRAFAGAAAAHQLCGQYAGARANIKKAREEEPTRTTPALQAANIYLAQGDAANARAIVQRATFIPDHIRGAYLDLVDYVAGSKRKAKDAADALTKVIFYGSRVWHTEAEESCRALLKIAPRNTFAYSVLANVYRATGDHDRHLEVLRRLVAIAPDDPEHHIRLGGLLRGLGRFKEAREQLEEAAKIAPGEVRPHLALAEYFVRNAQYDQAIERANRALAIKSQHARALEILVEAHRVTGDTEKAKEALRRLADSEDAPQAMSLRRKAALALLDGNLDGAVAHLTKAIETEKNPAQLVLAHVELADVQLRQNRVRDAVEELNKALAVDSTNTTALLRLARIYRLGRPPRPYLALITAQRAATVNPDAVHIRHEVAAARSAAGQHDLAIAEYQAILKVSPNDLQAALRLAQALFTKGDHAAAVARLNALLQQNQLLLPAQNTLISFYRRLGETDKAQAQLESLVRATPRLLGADSLAALYIHKNRLDDALALLDRALALQGDSPQPRTRLTQALAVQLKGGTGKAAASLATLAKEQPKNRQVGVLLACAHLANGDPQNAKNVIGSLEVAPESARAAYDALLDKLSTPGRKTKAIANRLGLAVLCDGTGWSTLARAHYDHLLTLLPNDLLLLRFLAAVCERQRDADGAIRTYQRMLQARTDYPFALQRLVRHNLLKKDYAQAEKGIRLLLKPDPNNARLLGMLAQAVHFQKRFDEAIDLYKRIIEQAPKLPGAYNNLAWIYAKEMDNLPEAEQLAKKALELTTPNSAEGAAIRDTLAWVYYRTDRLKEAMEYAQKAVEGAPGNAEIRYRLGLIYFRHNLRGGAARELTRALELDPDLPQKKEIDDILRRIKRRER